ncbi:MAG: hypothetical protein LPK46_03365 [Bacteroidota bacterium]|nr:hypothetical protein [Bacteroidota bacterium]
MILFTRYILLGMTALFISSCGSKQYLIQEKIKENVYFDEPVHFAEIQKKKKWNGDKLAFLFPHQILPNLDSVAHQFAPLVEDGYRIVVLTPPGNDILRIRGVMSFDSQVHPISEFIFQYISKLEEKYEETEITFIGEGLGNLPALRIGTNLDVQKWILVNPLYGTLESNLQMMGVEEGPQRDSLMSFLGLNNSRQWQNLVSFISERKDPDLLIDGYPLKYLHEIKDISMDQLLFRIDDPVLISSDPNFPWSSTFFRRELKKKVDKRSNFIWVNYTGIKADDQVNLMAEMKAFL